MNVAKSHGWFHRLVDLNCDTLKPMSPRNAASGSPLDVSMPMANWIKHSWWSISRAAPLFGCIGTMIDPASNALAMDRLTCLSINGRSWIRGQLETLAQIRCSIVFCIHRGFLCCPHFSHIIDTTFSMAATGALRLLRNAIIGANGIGPSAYRSSRLWQRHPRHKAKKSGNQAMDRSRRSGRFDNG